MCCYTKKLYRLLLLAGLLFSVQPMMVAGWENPVVAQNETTGQKGDPKKDSKGDSKKDPKGDSKKGPKDDSKKDPKGNSKDCTDMANPSCDDK